MCSEEILFLLHVKQNIPFFQVPTATTGRLTMGIHTSVSFVTTSLRALRAQSTFSSRQSLAYAEHAPTRRSRFGALTALTFLPPSFLLLRIDSLSILTVKLQKRFVSSKQFKHTHISL